MTAMKKDISRIEKLKELFDSLFQMLKMTYHASAEGFWAMMILHFLSGIQPIILAYITKLVFDMVGQIFADTAIIDFWRDAFPLLLLQGFLLIFGQMIGLLTSHINEVMEMRLTLYTQEMIFLHLWRMQGLSRFESPELHDITRLATENLRWGPRMVLNSLNTIMSSSIRVISFMGVLFFFSPLIALLLLLNAVQMLFARSWATRERLKLDWDNSPKLRKAHYWQRILSSTQYAKELRLFNLGNYFMDLFRDTTIAVQAETMLVSRRAKLRMMGVQATQSLILSVAWGFIILRAFAREISLGDVSFNLEAIRSVQTNLYAIMDAIAILNERAQFFVYYRQLMEMDADLPRLEPAQAIQPLRESIELRDISFRYSEDSPYVLKNVNLTLRKGESLAIVGLNGAGKTTLVKLLTRFYDPSAGQILWDGVDIRHFEPAALREKIGVVFQDFVRFDLSARENIGLGDIEHIQDNERIEKAAQDLGVDKFIKDLPQGYDTMLSRWLLAEGEKGTDLSGGQWQKIAIARTYLRRADLIMLDEPTAALDAEAENEIYGHFAKLVEDKASLLISHRFSTVRMADKVAVLEDACISEYGSHAELMAKAGTYARLYQLQASQYI